jgi:hypothetical protein
MDVAGAGSHPETADELPEAAADAVSMQLSALRRAAPDENTPELLAAALRAVQRPRAGTLCEELCLWLADHRRGRFEELPLSARNAIADSVSGALARLPASDLGPFWDRLSGADPIERGAMSIGLDALRAAHATPHLLAGLERVSDHHTRSLIVDCLEQVGDPDAVPGLARLQRESALPDWTLSRKIGRAIHAIGLRNPEHDGRTLLRPTEIEPDTDLVRPVSDTSDSRDLLRPGTG